MYDITNIFNSEDKAFYNMLPKKNLAQDIDFGAVEASSDVETYTVVRPREGARFLHETAIIEYHGKLFASWYSCEVNELKGRTPVLGCVSSDGGRTWGKISLIEDDPTGKILYCPPVYGIDEVDGKLYMFINEMVSADRMHAINLYVYDEQTEKFIKLWSRPSTFKLNTNVYRLENGKLMLPGRMSMETDGFPDIPCVLISDSGRIDAEWRLVKIQADNKLADGGKFIHPEIACSIIGKDIYMFCRDDERNVPLMFISRDNAETWSKQTAIDIPFSNSKIYAGTLSDGRCYVVGNIFRETAGAYHAGSRSKLILLISEKESLTFKPENVIALQDGFSKELGYGGTQWSYPAAYEADGKLYVIYTAEEGKDRGCAISVVPLK